MNWEAIGVVAELLGAIGVILSLVFVGAQVRASTLASKVENKLSMTRLLVQYQDMMIEKPELYELILRGRKNPEQLTKAEYLQFSNLMMKALWYISGCFYQYRKGLLDADDWFEIKVIAEYWLSSQSAYNWWLKIGRNSFTGDFMRFVEGEFRRFGFPVAQADQPR